MSEILPTLVVTVIGAILISMVARGLTRRERVWIWVAFAIHVLFACAQVPITLKFYGSSDMFLYFTYGEILARMMEHDAARVVPEVTALLLHNDHHLPLTIIGAGTATGSMSALAAFSFYLIGPSKYGVCVAFAIFSLCGKIAIYHVFRKHAVASLRSYAIFAALLVPSYAFWSSGLIKEAVALAGLGWAIYGLDAWIDERRRFFGWLLIIVGAMPVALIKAYILFPFALAGGCWYYWARVGHRRAIRPLYLGIGALLSVGSIVILSTYFPEYAFDNFGSQTARLQQIGKTIRGGSNYALGDTNPTGLAGQLAYAPLALLTSLFRPSLFEVRNMLMFINALETTFLTVLFIRILYVTTTSRVLSTFRSNPFLVFCLIFVFALGVAVGLASTNLGTLSRYRSPLIPFFTFLLLALGQKVVVESRQRLRSALQVAR